MAKKNDHDQKRSSDDNQNAEALSRLQDKLEDLRRSQAEKEAKSSKPSHDGSNMAMAFRACSELVLSIGVCGVIGYFVDSQLSSQPLFLIIGLLLGMGVGFAGVYRITNNMGMSVGYARKDDTSRFQSSQSQTQERTKNGADDSEEKNNL